MIDWWASKIGMLIFLTVVLGSLLTFANMQVTSLSKEKNYRIASDIARIIDSVGSMDGSYSEYIVESKNYVLVIDDNSLDFNGVKRYFSAKAQENVISNQNKIRFKNNNGVIVVW